MPDKFKATVWVCKGTGISHRHVKYLNGEGAAKAFFTSRSVVQWTTSAIRGFVSMYARDVQSIHLPGTLADYCECDFICYENNGEGIFWVNKIENLENVNENTTRIYFTPDYYHTWIERVKFGNCLVERRHFEDMSDPYLSLLPEPINVPTYTTNGPMQNLDSKIEALMGDSTYAIYLATDQYNNSNAPDVQVHNIGGAPYWGKLALKDSATDAANYLKQYMNNDGWQSTSLLPLISNVQRVVYVPKALVQESTTGYFDEGNQILPLKIGKFGKLLSPQYLKGRIVQNGSGAGIDMDITRFNIDDDTGRIGIDFKLEGCGGLYPKLRTSFAIYVNWDDDSVDQDTSIIDFADFPEIPVHAMIAPRPTTMGAINAFIGGATSGFSLGASTGAAVGGGYGAAIGGAIGAGVFSEVAVQNALNPAMNDYLKTGGTPEMTVAQKLYSHIALLNRPTPEGERILNDFFNSYGYFVMLREELTLKHGNNFTYIKLAEPPTQVTPNIPHVAFKEISSLLMEGVTIWAVDIGSAKEYS